MNRIAFVLLALCGVTNMYAQNDSIKKPLSISGYAEVYYQADFNNPKSNNRPGFVYSHNRNNEVNVNLAFIKAGYNTENLRANLALAAGTYMNANYAAEQGVMKNIYEANVGLKLSKNHNLWIDAGIFPSHLGFESAVGKDNWTLSRSLFADNSPYFETGAKISYTSETGKWFLSALVLNGWQRIQRVNGNFTPAFGHQITFKPNEKLTLNSGSFIGNDKLDSIRQMRYFHNLYGIYQINKKIGITAGFDAGAEQKMKGSKDYNIWYTPVLLLKYNLTDKFSLTARGEYYQDEKGVIIYTGTENDFRTFGYSFNADYYILPNLVWRTEIRNLNSKDAIFINRNNVFNTNSLTAVTALAVSF
ncbi:porin [Chryseobacterium sp. GP-SGM7]|uniref:porin n=1 Tax=Chryseobacterium sp. GP-SGM7 TaxID=3411323 RepID=UPI003B94CD5B